MSGINDALEDTIGKYRDLHSIPLEDQQLHLQANCLTHPALLYREGIKGLMSLMAITPTTYKDAPAYPVQRRGTR